MTKIITIISICLGLLCGLAESETNKTTHSPISDRAYEVLNQRTAANRKHFYIYKDADSGFNHGFASGVFADSGDTVRKIQIDATCLDDINRFDGCSIDPNKLDRNHVTVLKITFAPLSANEFVGLNIQDPKHPEPDIKTKGYNLTNSTQLLFDARSPDQINIQFGLGGGMSMFQAIPKNWTAISIPLNSLKPKPDLSSVHTLFTVSTNAKNTSNGGILLLDNIRLEPTPQRPSKTLGFPLSTESFGTAPLRDSATKAKPIPSDILVRNLTTTYESALAAIALLERGRTDDLENAQSILDTFHFAMRHDTALPAPLKDSSWLRNGYSSGDIATHHIRETGDNDSNTVRFAGFSAKFCGSTHYCLIMDGATGGNIAFAIIALLDGFQVMEKRIYLDDARTLASWISNNLTDHTGKGYGGYYLGYADNDPTQRLIKGKSVENNADIYAAFSRLAAIEARLGNINEAKAWTNKANIAGDFVMAMHDSTTGCFHTGTVPAETLPGPGVIPGKQKTVGSERINSFPFIDASTFSVFALAETARYRNPIDWRRSLQCILGKYKRSVDTAGITFHGFSIDQKPIADQQGIAWEFTAQAVLLMQLIDLLHPQSDSSMETNFYLKQLRQAQQSAPFTDRHGLVASTLKNGHRLAPIDQCLNTPLQCIPQRVGLAATAWAIFAEKGFNPLAQR